MKSKHRRSRTKKRYNKPKNTVIAKMPLILQKCSGLIPITNDTGGAATEFTKTFNRYDLGSILSPYGNFGINNTRRFQQVWKNYEQYIITGFKLKWIPTNTRGTVTSDGNGGFTAAGIMNPIICYDDINTTNIGNASLD